MTAQRDGRAYWLDFFPFEQHITQCCEGTGDESAVMLVDVGGARGHEIQAIKSRYAHLPGKFVLQDLPDTVAQALDVPGLVGMAHDFFTEQTVKGKRSVTNSLSLSGCRDLRLISTFRRTMLLLSQRPS